VAQDGVLPHRLDQRRGDGGRHQAPDPCPEQRQPHANYEIADHIRTDRDHRQFTEAHLAAEQTKTCHGPAHERERDRQAAQHCGHLRSVEQAADRWGHEPHHSHTRQAEHDTGRGCRTDLVVTQFGFLHQGGGEPHTSEELPEQHDEVRHRHESKLGRLEQPRDGRDIGEVGHNKRHSRQGRPAQAGGGLSSQTGAARVATRDAVPHRVGSSCVHVSALTDARDGAADGNPLQDQAESPT
jgi:hypothetical protein